MVTEILFTEQHFLGKLRMYDGWIGMTQFQDVFFYIHSAAENQPIK